MPPAKTKPRERMAGIHEVADYLGLKVQTLYNWRVKGIGPKSSRVGGLVRYRWSDVDAWLESRAKGDAA
ncbi:helix-turn-helix domain-containing protein [Micromonospora sp. NPDC048999]|uniref:helix-turn-helix transcriptional regulator n=1 Tax=Micromonospora sp. NPDC048999 TaxID=3155391 RepID=UPI0033C5021F